MSEDGWKKLEESFNLATQTKEKAQRMRVLRIYVKYCSRVASFIKIFGLLTRLCSGTHRHIKGSNEELTLSVAEILLGSEWIGQQTLQTHSD